MYLSINILLITSYLFITTCNSKLGLNENMKHKSGHNHCYVKMPSVDYEYMPIPFEVNLTRLEEVLFDNIRDLNTSLMNPTVIRPDKNGYLFFKHNNTYKLACSENGFKLPVPFPFSEITVRCVNGYFKYMGKMFKFDKFSCQVTPKPKLVRTERNCQEKEFHKIYKIGFQSRETFLNLYRVCFDTNLNNTLYSWYFVNTPMYEHYQIPMLKPSFIKTRESNNIDIYAKYKNLTKILKKHLKIEDLLDEYGENDEYMDFVTPINLISEHEFLYVTEEYATYFYENTAPQWLTFNKGIWKKFEKLFRRNLAKSSGRHLIVAGTFLKDSNLGPYDNRNLTDHFSCISLTIPEYFWKMDYDLDRKSGTVYIGVNNPYKKINHSVHICDTIPCPGRDLSKIQKKTKLFYCCSKESFEKNVGYFDSIIYKKF